MESPPEVNYDTIMTEFVLMCSALGILKAIICYTGA